MDKRTFMAATSALAVSSALPAIAQPEKVEYAFQSGRTLYAPTSWIRKFASNKAILFSSATSLQTSPESLLAAKYGDDGLWLIKLDPLPDTKED